MLRRFEHLGIKLTDSIVRTVDQMKDLERLEAKKDLERL